MKFILNLRINTAFLLLSLFLLIGFSPAISADKPVLKASEGVHRIWIGLKLSGDLPDNLKEKISINGFVSILIKEKRVIAFSYNNEIYLVSSKGSSFAINLDTFVTNEHVLESAIAGDNKTAFLVVNKSLPLELKKIDIEWHNKAKDLAIFKVPGMQAAPLKLASPKSLYKTAKVSSIGFPGDSDDLGGINDAVGYFNNKIRAGSLVSPRNMDNRKDWEHNAAVSGGNSGGPLVNTCGEVVGINTFVHKKNNNVLFAVSVEELLPVLKNQGYSFEQSSSKCVIGESTPNWLKALIATIVLALLLILLYLVNLKKQIKLKKPIKSDSMIIRSIIEKMGGKSTPNESENDGYQWLTDSTGKQYRIDSVLGKVFKESARPAQQHKDTNPVKLIISEQGKTLANKTINQEQIIIIGRSNSSDISINDSTVSSQHIKIEHTTTGMILTDLDSTNGTFIDSVRINPNTPISITNNTDIMLVDPQQGFKLTIDNPEIASNSKYLLRSINGNQPVINLYEGVKVTIGRSSSNDIVIDEGIISNKHCYVTQSNGKVMIEDNQSTNGTYVDSINNPINKTEITKDQIIYLANENFAYRLENNSL